MKFCLPFVRGYIYRLDFVDLHLFVCLDRNLSEVEWQLVEYLRNMCTGDIGASVAFSKLFTCKTKKAISSILLFKIIVVSEPACLCLNYSIGHLLSPTSIGTR